VIADRYLAERDISSEFLRTAGEWIAQNGEVFVVLRYLHAAGAKDYAFVRSAAEFDDLIKVCPIGTNIEVFREPQLPLHGVVTPEFISRISEAVPGWGEYLYVLLEPRAPGDARLFGEIGGSSTELAEDLSHHHGRPIAVGACPPSTIQIMKR
jgi:hypothetical protein